jgi:hypothetical protein
MGVVLMAASFNSSYQRRSARLAVQLFLFSAESPARSGERARHVFGVLTSLGGKCDDVFSTPKNQGVTMKTGSAAEAKRSSYRDQV